MILRLILVALLSATVPAPVLGVDYIRLSPSEFAEDLVKASVLAEGGHYDDAIAILKVLIGDDPDDPDALSLMGYSLRKVGQADRARGFYERALAIDPGHLGANQYLGELHVEQGDLAGARVRLDVLDQACMNTCAGRDALARAIAAAAD